MSIEEFKSNNSAEAEMEAQRLEILRAKEAAETAVPEPNPEEAEAAKSGMELRKNEQITKDAQDLESVRKQLGIEVSHQTSSSPEIVTEKIPPTMDDRIETERRKELTTMFTGLATELDEFQATLKGNQFNKLSFNAEDLKKAVSSEFEVKKVLEAVEGVNRRMKRDLLPEDPADRMAVQPQNFTRVIEGLSELKGTCVGLRSRLENQKPARDNLEFKQLSIQVGALINTLGRQVEGIEESASLLRAYRGR